MLSSQPHVSSASKDTPRDILEQIGLPPSASSHLVTWEKSWDHPGATGFSPETPDVSNRAQVAPGPCRPVLCTTSIPVDSKERPGTALTSTRSRSNTNAMVVGPTRAQNSLVSSNFPQAIWKLLQASRTTLASLCTPLHVSDRSRVIQDFEWLSSNMEVQELVPATAQFTSEVQHTLKTFQNPVDDFKTILSSLNILPVGSDCSEVPLVSYKAPMSVPQVWIDFGQFWQPPDLFGVVVITIKP